MARPSKVVQRRAMLQILAAAALSGGRPARASSVSARGKCSSDHIAWVVEVLKRIQTIIPGMTRDDLMRVFTTEGGLSFGLQRAFVSRDCPYFKVNVTFRRASTQSSDTPGRGDLVEYDNDVIVSISQPYMQFSIMD